MDSSSYTQQCNEITEWHPSIDLSGYAPSDVCTVHVSTNDQTCNDYCEGQGLTCHHAQDNAGGGCDLGDHALHERQSQDQNGCDQHWGDQICSCGAGAGSVSVPTHVPSTFVGFDNLEMDTCYQLHAKNIDALMHEMGATGGCSDGNPIYAQSSDRADSFKFVAGKCTDGGQCGDTSNDHVVSIESCQSPGRFLRHCNYHM